MGVMIELDIVPEKIDAAEWERVYEETLILLNEYSFMDKIVDKLNREGYIIVSVDWSSEKDRVNVVVK